MITDTLVFQLDGRVCPDFRFLLVFLFGSFLYFVHRVPLGAFFL